MASDEHAFVLSGKIRPAIIVVADTTKWAHSPIENLVLCAPLFGISKPTFSQGFVLKSQAFHYPSKFYLPSDLKFQLAEGIARFELMQAVHPLVTKPFPDANQPIMLTEEFFALLQLQLTRFLGGVLSKEDQEELDVYGQLIIEEARKQGVKV